MSASPLPPPRPRVAPKLTAHRESATAVALAPEAFADEELPTRHYIGNPLTSGASGTRPVIREVAAAPIAPTPPLAAEVTATLLSASEPVEQAVAEDGFWESAPRYSNTELQAAAAPDPLFASEQRALARRVCLWALSAVFLLALSELAVSWVTR